MTETLESIKQEYLNLSHAMQTGVAYMMKYDPAATSAKHLRVGVNSAMVDSGALAGLLMAKGIITELEYFTALRDKMKEEVDSYSELLKQHLSGANITLR
jgi:hypothetical protein